MDTLVTEKKKFNLYIIFAGCILLFIVLFGYFTIFKSHAIPGVFFTLYREQDSIVSETIRNMQFDYGKLGQQIQAQNASEAANISKEGLLMALKNKEKEIVISTKTTELKLLLPSVSDSTIREKLLKLFGLLDERNQKMKTVIETQIRIMTTIRNEYAAVSVGEKGKGMPQNIDTVIAGSQKELQSIIQLQTTIGVAYEEIVSLSGGQQNIPTADAIRMSLSATPIQNEPFITDFPTPTPAPTMAPTEIPASPSATIASPSAQ